MQSKGLSRVFSNTTVQKHQFFNTHLSLLLLSRQTLSLCSFQGARLRSLSCSLLCPQLRDLVPSVYWGEGATEALFSLFVLQYDTELCIPPELEFFPAREGFGCLACLHPSSTAQARQCFQNTLAEELCTTPASPQNPVCTRVWVWKPLSQQPPTTSVHSSLQQRLCQALGAGQVWGAQRTAGLAPRLRF